MCLNEVLLLIVRGSWWFSKLLLLLSNPVFGTDENCSNNTKNREYSSKQCPPQDKRLLVPPLMMHVTRMSCQNINTLMTVVTYTECEQLLAESQLNSPLGSLQNSNIRPHRPDRMKIPKINEDCENLIGGRTQKSVSSELDSFVLW